MTDVVTYNYKKGLKFSLVTGLSGSQQYISFKLANEDKYLRHHSYILYLHWKTSIYVPDAEFVLCESSYFPGFISIKSTGLYSTWFVRRDGLKFKIESKQDTIEYNMDASLNFIASDLRIKKIDDVNRYSVNVTVDDFPPIWNISKSQNPFIVKYRAPNNDSKLFNVTGSSIVITTLDSYTLYKFSAGVQNEFGILVFGIVSDHQTEEDIPTGPPLNFTVAQGNFSTLLLSWGNVENSKRKGIIQMYNYSCQDSEVSIWKQVANSTFQETVSHLKPDTIYNCSIAACTKVGCGVRSSVSNKTSEGIPQASAPIGYVSYINSSSIYVNWSDISTDNWRVLQNRTFCIDIEKNYSSNHKLVQTKCVNYSPYLGNYSTEIHDLEPYTNYSVLVYCKNEAGIGRKEVKEKQYVVTDQLAPTIPPKNLKFASVGVNNMLFQWDPLNESEYFGVIEGYSLVVKAIVEETNCMLFNESLQQNIIIPQNFNACAGLEWATNIKNSAAKHFSITNLFGNTMYMVNISANTKYRGVFSSGVYNKTAVGIPLMSVLHLQCCNKSYNSLTVCWDHSPPRYLQGERTRYEVSLKKADLSSAEHDFQNISSFSIQYKALSLQPLTNYLILVSAATSAGVGLSARVNCTTDNALPKLSSKIIDLYYLNSSSISVSWNDIPLAMWGIPENQQFCVDVEKFSTLVKTVCVNYNKSNYRAEIHGLDPFTNYSVLVYCKNKVGNGEKDISKKERVQTDELPPSVPPKNINFLSVSVNSMVVNWEAPNKIDYFGIIKGYSVLVKAVVEEKDYKVVTNRMRRDVSEIYNGSLNLECAENISDPLATTLQITNLFGNTKYIFFIAANTKYHGVFSSGIENITKEGVPLVSVINLRCCDNAYDSLTVCWEHTPPLYLQGVRTAYMLHYSKVGDLHTENDLLQADSLYYQAFPLEPITSYQVNVSAWTNAGEGVLKSIICVTGESVPNQSPTGLYALSMQFSYATTVFWIPIPKKNWQGQLLGYQVAYKLLEQGEVIKIGEVWQTFKSENLNNFTVINGLNVYSKYSLKVAGYTKIGIGPYSTEVDFSMCRILSPIIEVEYISIEPFVFSYLMVERPAGVMIAAIEQSLLDCAGFCKSFLQNITVVYREMAMSSKEFEMRHSNVIKLPVAVPKQAIGTSYSPTMSTPGFVLIFVPSAKQDLLKENDVMVFGNVSSVLAIFVLYFLLNCLFGSILFYCDLENLGGTNQCFTLNGIIEKIYLVITTVTTVGYGEKLPLTFRGKILIMVWTFLGIVLTGICVATLLSALTVTAVKSINFVFPKGYIVAKVGSPEFEWASMISSVKLLGGKNFSTHQDVIDALKAGQANYAVVEQYVIESYRSTIQESGIEIAHTFKTTGTNYGVSLGGNYSLLDVCLKRFFKRNSAMVDKEMESLKSFNDKQNNSARIKQSPKRFQLLSGSSPMFQKILYALSITLVILWIAGGVYEVFRRKKKNRIRVGTSLDKKLAYIQALKNLSNEYNDGFVKMIVKLQEKTDVIIYKHNEELLKLRNKYSKLYGVNFKYVAVKDLGVPLEIISQYKKEIKNRPKVSPLKGVKEYALKKTLWLRFQFDV